MEFEEIIKFVWGAMILVVFVASRFKGKKRLEQQTEDDQQEEGSQMPFDLEEFFGRVSPKVEPSKVKDAPAPKPQYEALKPVDPITQEEISDKKESKKIEFDLRQAVIMSEILNPKFKNE